MASTPSNAGSIIIMSQVTSQNNPMPVTTGESNKEHSNAQLSKFFKGQPEVLGVIGVFTGLLQLGLGIGFHFSCHDWRCFSLSILNKTAVALWTGLMYIVSGSISVAASNNPTKKMIKSSLIINTISTVISGVALLIYVIYLIDASHWLNRYSTGTQSTFCSFYESGDECEGEFNLSIATFNTGVILLIYTLLQFCSSMSMSIFGCKIVCQTATTGTSVVIYQNTSISAGAVTTVATTTLDVDGQ